MKQILFSSLLVFAVLTGCATPTSSVSTAIDATWDDVFSTTDRARFQATEMSVNEAQADVGIQVIYALIENDSTLGYAFQATVDGDGGRDSVVFRLTIYESAFRGFSVVSHREHTTFGVKQFNALRQSLPGTNVSFAAVVNILNQANVGRTGLTETYDGIMPAIEAMTEVYLA